MQQYSLSEVEEIVDSCIRYNTFGEYDNCEIGHICPYAEECKENKDNEDK